MKNERFFEEYLFDVIQDLLNCFKDDLEALKDERMSFNSDESDYVHTFVISFNPSWYDVYKKK